MVTNRISRFIHNRDISCNRGIRPFVVVQVCLLFVFTVPCCSSGPFTGVCDSKCGFQLLASVMPHSVAVPCNVSKLSFLFYETCRVWRWGIKVLHTVEQREFSNSKGEFSTMAGYFPMDRVS